LNDRPEENPAAAFDPAEQEAGVIGGPTVAGGTLPKSFLPGVLAGCAVVALAVLLVTGNFTIVLLFLLTFGLALPAGYIWSRLVQGRRAATDRSVTLGIPAGFGIAVLPLFSLLYEVVKRGVPRFDSSFFSESQRGLIGAAGGAQHAIIGTLVITGVATL